MNNLLRIEKIEKIDLNLSIKLQATLINKGETETVWFEYPTEYSNYVCDECIDAFVISVLPFAMRNSLDIISNIPISEKLKYQICNYYIPILAKYQKSFSKIELICPTVSVNYEGKAVGTGISCGVDSYYSVFKHLEVGEQNFKLTHLVTMNVGSFGYKGGESSFNWFMEETKIAKGVAEKLNLPLIVINSNLMEFYGENHAYSGTLRMVGAILGLQKLFSKYYISAGFDISGFDISAEENDDYDFFNLFIGSNESLEFFSTGMEATRFERTNYISDFPVTYDTLTVCLSGVNNCGRCEKCLRTLWSLTAINKLDLYKKSFDIESFKKKKMINMAKIRYYGKGYMNPLYKEIFEWLKRKHLFEYWVASILAAVVVSPYKTIKRIFEKND